MEKILHWINENAGIVVILTAFLGWLFSKGFPLAKNWLKYKKLCKSDFIFQDLGNDNWGNVIDPSTGKIIEWVGKYKGLKLIKRNTDIYNLKIKCSEQKWETLNNFSEVIFFQEGTIFQNDNIYYMKNWKGQKIFAFRIDLEYYKNFGNSPCKNSLILIKNFNEKEPNFFSPIEYKIISIKKHIIFYIKNIWFFILTKN